MHEELEELIKALRNCNYPGCGHYCSHGCIMAKGVATCGLTPLLRKAADVIEGLFKKESTTTRTIKRGRWRTSKYDAFNVRCSECGHVSGNFWNFCPNCGADMREAPKEKA